MNYVTRQDTIRPYAGKIRKTQTKRPGNWVSRLKKQRNEKTAMRDVEILLEGIWE